MKPLAKATNSHEKIKIITYLPADDRLGILREKFADAAQKKMKAVAALVDDVDDASASHFLDNGFIVLQAGEDQHREFFPVMMGSEHAQEHKAAHFRHHQVEHNQSREIRIKHRPRNSAARRGRNRVPDAPKNSREGIPLNARVINDQNLRHDAHPCVKPPPSHRRPAMATMAMTGNSMHRRELRDRGITSGWFNSSTELDMFLR
jgi:hypothetical protein